MADDGGRAAKAAPSGVANVQRRTWDAGEYEAAAAARATESEAAAGETAAEARKRKRLARDPLHQGVITERAHLKARDADVDLGAADLGRKRSVAAGAAPAGQAGFYCGVCDCVLKDSKGWLDHINGKWHNRALGMSMRVEKVGVDAVAAKLAALKERKKAEREGAAAAAPSVDPESAAGARLAAAAAAEAAAREEARARREAKKAAARRAREAAAAAESDAEEEDDEAAAMAAAMGFGGFGK